MIRRGPDRPEAENIGRCPPGQDDPLQKKNTSASPPTFFNKVKQELKKNPLDFVALLRH
jgi:hypothetical protein